MFTLAFTFVAALLATFARASGSGNNLTLNDGDNGKTVTLAPGGTLTVTLKSNRTTGYKWNLPNPPDARVLKLASSTYNAPSDPVPGRGGTEVWVFQAVGSGAVRVSLRYARSFGTDESPTEFTVTVNVK